MTRYSLTLTLVSLALVGPSLGQKIYGIDWNGDEYGSGAGNRVITFDASDPATVTELGQTGLAYTYMCGLEFVNGVLYAYSDAGDGSLYTIDPTDGSATFIGGGGVLVGDTVAHFAWSEVDQKMYALHWKSIGKVRIYEVDLVTGVSSLAFELVDPTTMMETLAIAIDPVTGDFFVHNHLQSRLFVRVGSELQALPLQQGFPGLVYGMTFDPNTASLYANTWQGRANLRTVNLTTGGMTFLGNIGPLHAGSNTGEYNIADLAVAEFDCATTKFCNPSTGSTNNVATISISGCELANGVVVRLSSAPVDQFTYLLIGDGSQVVSQPPGAIGDLCVVGGSCLGRYAKDIGAIASDGTFTTLISNSASGGPGFGIPTCGGSIQAGETWNFQFWHRQSMGQPSSFSEAIGVTFE